jgi:hypothetical protein
MAQRFLLYIDILGFSDLVAGGSPIIHDLYEVIASLNVHNHSAFRAIVFSDTILVYNTDGGDTKPDRQYLVMFLCEFAQDLQYRLTMRGVFFRAVLVYGEFTHYELNSIPCFFGPALIDACKAEKELQAIGLFMHKSIVGDSDIFKTAHFSEHFDFVFITQSLDRVENFYGGHFPIDQFTIEEMELIDHLVAELLHLEQLHHGKYEYEKEKTRVKYANTLALFQTQYPKTLRFLEGVAFDWAAICPSAAWPKVLSRFPENYSWAIKSRISF